MKEICIMNRKNKIWTIIGLILVCALFMVACNTETGQKKVAKVDSIESDEEASGGMTVENINPEEMEEEIEDKEDENMDESGSAVTTIGGTQNITVATYNIATGREVNFDYSIIAADIRNSGAAIVALQEIDQGTLRNGSQDTMAILSAQTGMPYYAFAPALSPYQEGEYGVAVLSKYPIESYMFFDMPKSSAKEEQRVLLQTEININGTMLDFYVTHAQSNSITQQLAAANDYISTSSKFIYAGDFNTSNYGYFSAIKNSYTIIGSGNPILTTANYSFDNMVISNNIKSSNVRTYNTGHSDHYMVLANVAIPNGN